MKHPDSSFNGSWRFWLHCLIRGFREIWTGRACNLIGRLSIECERCKHHQAVIDYLRGPMQPATPDPQRLPK